MSQPDPSTHEAHELPLGYRIVERIIHDWLATATGIANAANGNPPLDDYERGVKQGIDNMAHSHLANYSYTVVPQIIDELRRAGLLTDKENT